MTAAALGLTGEIAVCSPVLWRRLLGFSRGLRWTSHGLRLPEIGIGLGPVVGNVAHVRVEGEDLLLRRLHASGFEFAESLHSVGSEGCGEFLVIGETLVDLRQVFAGDED